MCLIARIRVGGGGDLEMAQGTKQEEEVLTSVSLQMNPIICQHKTTIHSYICLGKTDKKN
jgi:hypothetical protein